MPPSSIPGTSAEHATTPAKRPSIWSLILIFVAAAIALRLMHPGSWKPGWLEDLPVYSHAVNDWLAGRNPYNAAMAPLYFLYPPFFLLVAGFFARILPQGWGPTLYVGLHFAATCALPLVLARYFFRQAWLGPFFAFLLFFASPRFLGVDAFGMGNIASLLYCLAFLGAVPGIRRNRWEWFYLAVIFAAMIKITFLALLLLPLLAGRKQWWRSIACGGVVVLGNLAEKALVPTLYGGYQWSLQQGILNEGSVGFGVFGILSRFLHKRTGHAGLAPYAVAGVLAIAIVVVLFLLRRRLERIEDPAANGQWLALVVAAVILVNPRELQYDMDIAYFAAFVLLVYILRTKRLLVLMVALFLPGVAAPRIITNPHLWNMYATLVVLVAFAAGCWRLWKETGEGRQPVTIAS